MTLNKKKNQKPVLLGKKRVIKKILTSWVTPGFSFASLGNDFVYMPVRIHMTFTPIYFGFSFLWLLHLGRFGYDS